MKNFIEIIILCLCIITNYYFIAGFVSVMAIKIIFSFRKSIIDFLLPGLTKLTNYLTNYSETLKTNSPSEVTLFATDEQERFKEFLFDNGDLLENYEALKMAYTKLIMMDEYINFCHTKIVMTLAVIEGKTYSFHHNVVVDNNTTFEQYFSKVEHHIQTKFYDGYGIDIIDRFIIRVWDIDDVKNGKIKRTKDARVLVQKPIDNRPPLALNPGCARFLSTTVNNVAKGNYIMPLKSKAKLIKPFYTMDIETMKSDNGDQIPVFISFASKTKTSFFLIDNNIPVLEGVNDLWTRFFNYLESGLKNKVNTVFVHNLGNFDGLFIYKFLASKYGNNNLKAILDDSNKFICISVKISNIEIIFKDSLRIFPCSLEELSKIFSVQGKIGSYRSEFNSFNLFKDKSLMKEFIKYGCQDSKALHQALSSAQISYFNNYGVDITSIVSIPSLAFKIFRLNFLNKDIPILSGLHDSFLRKSYFGGATDIYSCYARNVHYYDVNSLYPYAMCKPMPLNLIASYGTEERCKDINLNTFFGFLHVEVECPSSLARPMLPYKLNGKTIFPRGIFSGVYFSEELKAVLPLGYKVLRIYAAREFSKDDIFTSYVNNMYKLKMEAKGAERWIAKMLLNSLYGLFGRRQELIDTITINRSELRIYLATNIVKTIIPVSDDKYTILIVKNINHDLISQLNITFHTSFNEYQSVIKTNVAIASAVTAYARVHMIPFKLDEGTIYTDTDSIFTTKSIKPYLIGKGLGLMKDELEGLIIKEAYFLGIKQYGFWYYDNNNSRIEKSIWAGVSRNSLSFNDFISLKLGNKITRDIPNRFFRSIINLSIVIKDSRVTIEFNPHKNLINNVYEPIIIYKEKMVIPCHLLYS